MTTTKKYVRRPGEKSTDAARRLSAAGVKQAAIARGLGVSRQLVSKAVRVAATRESAVVFGSVAEVGAWLERPRGRTLKQAESAVRFLYHHVQSEMAPAEPTPSEQTEPESGKP